MTKKILALAPAAVLVGLLASLGSSVLAANFGPRALITQPIDNRQIVTLYGNTRPEATAKHDRGRVADTFPGAQDLHPCDPSEMYIPVGRDRILPLATPKNANNSASIVLNLLRPIQSPSQKASSCCSNVILSP